MITVEEARAIIRETLAPLDAETSALETAAGRVLAEPVIAKLSQPPFTASAMDGYAVRIADANTAGARLQVVGESAAGQRFTGELKQGCAVRIFTGAPLPTGADHVVIQENTTRDGDAVVLSNAQTQPSNIRAAGIDFENGAVLIEKGERLSATLLSLAAAGGNSTVAVRKPPRVALIANGDELVTPGDMMGPDDIICSIPYALAPMIRQWGGAPTFLGIAKDDPESIKAIAEKALAHDLVVPIGGASVGDKDFMRSVFKDLGYAPAFEKVSVKPGKPTWFGALGKAHVLGLPGNPASAIVVSILFLKTAIEALLALNTSTDGSLVAARTTRRLPPNGPRETYLRAGMDVSADGVVCVTPFDKQDSSLLSIMARSDALIRREANAPEAVDGAVVECIRGF